MSSIFILDSQCQCLIQRSYKDGIVENDEILRNFREFNAINKFKKPVFKVNGINYIFVKQEELIFLSIGYIDSMNCMTIVLFLNKFILILKSYFKVDKLIKDIIIDNFIIIYELFDEMFDNGIPQLTDLTILQDVIKLEVNKSESEAESKIKLKKKSKSKNGNDDDSKYTEEINSSILRSSTTNISWRPKGIYYTKNEFFIDVVEKIDIIINPNNEIIKHEIKGQFNAKCYLSGMPELNLVLNDLKYLKYLKFHQCVLLNKLQQENLIEFIPPDGDFVLCEYNIPIKSTPMIEIIKNDIKIDKEFLYLKFKIKTNFRTRLLMNYLKVCIPVKQEEFNINWKKIPKFKCQHGTVKYDVNNDEINWNLNGIGGDRVFELLCRFSLNSENDGNAVEELGMDPKPKEVGTIFNDLKKSLNNEHENDDREKHENKLIKFQFELPDMTISGIKIDYLKVMENNLKYNCFPWVRYKVCNNQYFYRV